MYFSPRDYQLLQVLGALLFGTPSWEQRYNIAWYVQLCSMAGFADTDDQMRACAQRYIAGKRKVTPPGHQRRKREAKERAKLLTNAPPALIAAITEVIGTNEKAVQQYQAGNAKALNALVGQTLKRYAPNKVDPAVVLQLLTQRIGTTT